MSKRYLEALQRIRSIAAAAHRYDFKEYDRLFKEIAELAVVASHAPATQSPELVGPYAGCRRVFTHYNEAYYSKSIPRMEDRLDEVGFSIAADEGGTAGEFCIRWSELSGERVARLEVFDEAWGALALFADVMAVLAARTDAELVKRIDSKGYWSGQFKSITPEEVCAIARECGVADATKRDDAGPKGAIAIVADVPNAKGEVFPSAALRQLDGRAGMVWHEDSKTLRYVGGAPTTHSKD